MRKALIAAWVAEIDAEWIVSLATSPSAPRSPSSRTKRPGDLLRATARGPTAHLLNFAPLPQNKPGLAAEAGTFRATLAGRQ